MWKSVIMGIAISFLGGTFAAYADNSSIKNGDITLKPEKSRVDTIRRLCESRTKAVFRTVEKFESGLSVDGVSKMAYQLVFAWNHKQMEVVWAYSDVMENGHLECEGGQASLVFARKAVSITEAELGILVEGKLYRLEE